MSKEMRVVVYRNYDPINWPDYSLIYEGAFNEVGKTVAVNAAIISFW